nr:hypothetical protein [Tanacetum cinerariifolium]
MGGVKTKGFCDLSVLDHINMSTDISNINWCSYIWRCLKKCMDGWKRTETNSFFLGPITLLAMLYVDGTVCNDFRIGRKRPPTTIWASKLLKERNLAEIKSEGLVKAKLAGPYQSEDNERTTGLNAAEYEMGLETPKEVIKTAESAEQEMIGSGSDLCEQEMMCSTDIEDNRGNAGQAPLDAVPLNYVSPMKEMMGRRKTVITETDRMKSPFYVRVVNADKDKNSNEKKLLVYLFLKMVGNVSDVLFETIYWQKSSRGQIESLGPQEPVDNNVLSSWSAYLNFLEGKKDKDSPAAVSIIDSKKQVKKVSTRKKKKVEDIDDMRIEAILNTQLGSLRNKYAAKLLLSYCNIYKSKIHEEMDMMKSAVFNVKAIKVSQRGKWMETSMNNAFS